MRQAEAEVGPTTCSSTCWRSQPSGKPGRKFTISAKKALGLRCFCGKRGYRRIVCNQEVAGSIPAGSTDVTYGTTKGYKSPSVDLS